MGSPISLNRTPVSFQTFTHTCPALQHGGLLGTPACTPTRHAAGAGSATYHQRTADVAGGRVSHLDKFSERSNRVTAIGVHCWLNGHRKGLEQFALVTGDEFPFEPPEHVVDNRLRVSNWLVNKAKVQAETVQSLLRHAQIRTTLDLYTQEDGDETQAARGEFLAALGTKSEAIQ